MKPLPLAEVRRILVVRTDHVGDLICSTPFLRALHQAAPQAELHALVPALGAQALEGNPNVQRVFSDLDGSYRDYDLAVALSPRSRTYKLVARTGARLRAGYLYKERFLNRLLCRLWLTHPVEISVRAHLQAGRPVPHEVEQHAEFARGLGLEPVDLELELPLAPEDEAFGREHADGRVVLHFSPGWLTHGWTPQDFAELARAVAATAPILITYGPQEANLVRTLPADLPVLGEMTLKRWAGVLGASRAVISPDTGAVHIAAARKRPVVVCYQPEHFALCSQQWSPWRVPQRNLAKGAPAATRAEVLQALAALLAG